MSADKSSEEAAIRGQVNALLAAVRAMDLDKAMSLYTSDVVSFDVEPPLQQVSAQAKRRNWSRVFAAAEPPLGYEVRDLAIAVADDLAFAYSLNHMTVTRKSGRRMDVWVRWTACFRNVAGRWLIAHDHVSVPADVASGRALLDLQPSEASAHP